MDNDYFFDWQADDYQQLTLLLNQRLLFVYSKSFDSQYNVIFRHIKRLQGDQNYKMFLVKENTHGICTPMLPFMEALSTQIEYGKKFSLSHLKEHIIRDLTGSDTIPYLVNALQLGQQYEVCGYLNDLYNNILVQIELDSQNKAPIFLFLGYPRFDVDSKNLIKLMLARELDDYYPQLAQAHFIFLNDEETPEFQEIYRFDHVDIRLREPKLDDMGEVLQFFSLHEKIALEEHESLYELCGGQLSKIDLLAQYLRYHTDINIKLNSFPDAVYSVLQKRVGSMGKQGKDVQIVLSMASEIGRSFQHDFLKYAMHSYSLDLDHILKLCNKEYFLTGTTERLEFRYDLVWQFFYQKSIAEKTSINRLLATTVAYFEPSNYYARGIYLEQAGEEKQAGEMYCYAFRMLLSEGFQVPQTLTEKVNKYAELVHISDFTKALSNYYLFSSNGEFTKAIKTMENDSSILPISLILLKDYMVGFALFKTASARSELLSAITTLEKVMERAKEMNELSLWTECASSLISFYVNTYGYSEKALSLSKDLTYYYSSRIDFDSQAAIGLHVLYRKWSALFSVEIAISKTELSVKFFENTLYHSQYLMAMNNYSANSIILGEYERALQCLEKCLQFVSRFPQVRIRKAYLLCNFYLAQLYSGSFTAHEVKSSLCVLIDQMEDNATKIIPLINVAICAALDDHENGLSSALCYLDTADSLNEELGDNYYAYYIYANKAAVKFLQGRYADAIADFRFCKNPPALTKATERNYLKRRYRLWLEVFESQQHIPTQRFNMHLIDKSEGGNAWNFFGRGFLGSDIQFWSEA